MLNSTTLTFSNKTDNFWTIVNQNLAPFVLIFIGFSVVFSIYCCVKKFEVETIRRRSSVGFI